MSRIELNHWFVKDNQISISLMRFYVRINILKNSDTIYYQLTVINSNREEVTINFYTIEDAITFTEQIINKCNNNEEIINKYKMMFANNEFASPYKKEEKESDKSIITLSPDEVDEAIIGYFGDSKNYRVSVENEIYLNGDQPIINFYLIEHFEYNKNKILLTKGDLKNALNDYIEFYGYELIDFKYVGGMHHTGYFIEENKPYYEGIELKVKEKAKKLTKNNKKTINLS